MYFTFDPGPSSQPSSWLTLQARLMADILRGCVTTMLQGWASLPPVNSSSRRNWGIWVLFPLPVSPATTTTRWRCRASRTRCRCWNTGSCSRSALKERYRFKYLLSVCVFLRWNHLGISTFSLWATEEFFSFFKSSLDASSAAAPSFLTPLFSLLSSRLSPPSPISSPARFSQDSSGSSSASPPCPTWPWDVDSCSWFWFCCCLSLVRSREMNWSRGLLAAVRLSSCFCWSLSLHSSHTSL